MSANEVVHAHIKLFGLNLPASIVPITTPRQELPKTFYVPLVKTSTSGDKFRCLFSDTKTTLCVCTSSEQLNSLHKFVKDHEKPDETVLALDFDGPHSLEGVLLSAFVNKVAGFKYLTTNWKFGQSNGKCTPENCQAFSVADVCKLFTWN